MTVLQSIHKKLTKLQEEVEVAGTGDYKNGYSDALRMVLDIIEEEAWDAGIDIED